LGHYVYALVDPRSGKIFYVGKASGNDRAFSHLRGAATEKEKSKRIAEIRREKLEPRVEILRYGLQSKGHCHDVEAAIIDAIGLENLTNSVRGHGIDRGRQSADQVERLHGSASIDVEGLRESLMLFFINRTFTPTLDEQGIYDATRQFWYGVAAKTRSPSDSLPGQLPYPTALAIADSVVIRAYSVKAWFPAGSTFSSRTSKSPKGRWEFVGQVLRDHPLVGRRLMRNGSDYPANELGYGYVN
jgi:hypothetical protein